MQQTHIPDLKKERQIPLRYSEFQQAHPTAVVQILHGLGEHSGRYSRFIRDCEDSGLACVTHDHRGHGLSEGSKGHFADEQGWQKLINDSQTVRQWAKEHFSGLPVILLGHSMGSFLAQHVIAQAGNDYSGLILSGSTRPEKLKLIPGHYLARTFAAFNPLGHSKLLNQLGIGDLNKAFEPARTSSDWLSRDVAEVDRFINDPLRLNSYTNKLWSDLTGALIPLANSSISNSIDYSIPVMIFGGSADPVGGSKGLTNLDKQYKACGFLKRKLIIYPEGRHEMLNELNREQVTKDVLSFIQSLF